MQENSIKKWAKLGSYLVDENAAIALGLLVGQHVDVELGLRATHAVTGARGFPAPQVSIIDSIVFLYINKVIFLNSPFDN